MRNPEPVQESVLRDQLPGTGPALRSFGHVEVVRIKRRSRKHPELLLFKGAPASKHSIAKSVLVSIPDANGELPAPWIDKEKGRIHLFYPNMEHPDLVDLMKDPGEYLCYLWTSSDGAKSHAWLLKTR